MSLAACLTEELGMATHPIDQTRLFSDTTTTAEEERREEEAPAFCCPRNGDPVIVKHRGRASGCGEHRIAVRVPSGSETDRVQRVRASGLSLVAGFCSFALTTNHQLPC